VRLGVAVDHLDQLGADLVHDVHEFFSRADIRTTWAYFTVSVVVADPVEEIALNGLTTYGCSFHGVKTSIGPSGATFGKRSIFHGVSIYKAAQRRITA
jgi:hypothetical protein